MARRNRYSDAEVVTMVDEFMLARSKNETSSSGINAWIVAEWAKEHGYPDIDGQYLNRRQASRDRLEEYKKAWKERCSKQIYIDNHNIYENFDFEAFYNSHKDKDYCGLDTAGRIINELRKQLQRCRGDLDGMKTDYRMTREENEKLKKENDKLKKELKETKGLLTESQKAATAMLKYASVSFGDIVNYEDAKSHGKEYALSKHLKKNSFLGEENGESATLAQIALRHEKEDGDITTKDGSIDINKLEKFLNGEDE